MNQKTVGSQEYLSHNVISYLFIIRGSKEHSRTFWYFTSLKDNFVEGKNDYNDLKFISEPAVPVRSQRRYMIREAILDIAVKCPRTERPKFVMSRAATPSFIMIPIYLLARVHTSSRTWKIFLLTVCRAPFGSKLIFNSIFSKLKEVKKYVALFS